MDLGQPRNLPHVHYISIFETFASINVASRNGCCADNTNVVPVTAGHVREQAI